MAGINRALISGYDRIIYENENRPLCNPSEKIKSIRLSNDLREIKKNNVIEIEFSDTYKL